MLGVLSLVGKRNGRKTLEWFGKHDNNSTTVAAKRINEPFFYTINSLKFPPFNVLFFSLALFSK